MPNEFTPERIEHAAQIYHSNNDAGAALGISPGSFGRLCRKYGVLTPQQRREQARQRARQRRVQRDE